MYQINVIRAVMMRAIIELQTLLRIAKHLFGACVSNDLMSKIEYKGSHVSKIRRGILIYNYVS